MAPQAEPVPRVICEDLIGWFFNLSGTGEVQLQNQGPPQPDKPDYGGDI
jgi:hypothetical protein